MSCRRSGLRELALATCASVRGRFRAGANRAAPTRPPWRWAYGAGALSLDTSPEVERLPVERWRRATPAKKLAVVSGLTQAVYGLALAGVRQRYPGATPHEHFLRLAIVTLGPDLARLAYPDMDRLGLL